MNENNTQNLMDKFLALILLKTFINAHEPPVSYATAVQLVEDAVAEDNHPALKLTHEAMCHFAQAEGLSCETCRANGLEIIRSGLVRRGLSEEEVSQRIAQIVEEREDKETGHHHVPPELLDLLDKLSEGGAKIQMIKI